MTFFNLDSGPRGAVRSSRRYCLVRVRNVQILDSKVNAAIRTDCHLAAGLVTVTIDTTAVVRNDTTINDVLVEAVPR